MVGIDPACATVVLLTEERPGFAGFRARAILQATRAVRAWTDAAAPIERAMPGRAGRLAAGVVFRANLPARAIEVAATCVRSRMARLVFAALPAVRTFEILAALPICGAIAIPIDAALLTSGAAGVVLRAIFARRRTAQLLPVAVADTATPVTAHRGGIVATTGAACGAPAGAPHWSNWRRRRRNRCRWLRTLSRNRGRCRRTGKPTPRGLGWTENGRPGGGPGANAKHHFDQRTAAASLG